MLHEVQSASRLNAEVGIEAEYDFLSDEYREFYQPGRATAFQAPLWMDMVHRRLAHGLNATQRTLTVRAKDGRLIALAPFVLQRMKGIRILAPADFGVCDYNSLVGDRDTLAALAGEPALVEAIHREVRRNCDVLMFRKVRVDDFDVGRLFPGSKSSAAENAAYHSEIGEDFEEWQRRTIRRKFSKELGRLQRQAEREFGSYEHRPAQDETEIRQVFDRLTEWRGGRFAGDLLQNPLYFDFYRDYAIAGLTGGDAITYVSYAAGQPAAVLFGPSGDGEFHAVDRAWATKDVVGAQRFLQRAWRAVIDEETGAVRVTDETPSDESMRVLHKTIAGVREDYAEMRDNTAIAKLIELTNHLTKAYPGGAPRALAEPLALMLAPVAPHIAEELWNRLGHTESLAHGPFPVAEGQWLVEDTVEIPVQVKGKLRARITVGADASDEALEAAALADPKIAELLDGAPRKVIVVSGKLVNIVP